MTDPSVPQNEPNAEQELEKKPLTVEELLEHVRDRKTPADPYQLGQLERFMRRARVNTGGWKPGDSPPPDEPTIVKDYHSR